MTSRKCAPALHLDVELDNEAIGRIVIVLLVNSPETLEFVSYFQNVQFNQNYGEHKVKPTLAHAIEIKPRDFIRFTLEDDSYNSTKPSTSSPNIGELDSCMQIDGSRVSRDKKRKESFNIQELTNGAVLYYSNETERGFYIFTSSWNSDFNTFNGCLIGRIYKGLSVVDYLTSLQTEEYKDNFISTCKIVDASLSLSNQKNTLQQYCNSRLDDFPSYPCDAAEFLDFKNLDNVFVVAYCIKSCASYLFRKAKYYIAMYKFKKAIQYLTYAAEKCQPIHRDMEIRMLTFIVPCILDSAVCKLKLKDFDGALEDCNEALEINPMNPKIFYRRGQAHHGKMSYEQSLYDLYTAVKLAPDDKSIKNEIAAVEAEVRVYRKIDRRRSSSDASVETLNDKPFKNEKDSHLLKTGMSLLFGILHKKLILFIFQKLVFLN